MSESALPRTLRVSRGARLFAAALLWSLVGAGLGVLGARFTIRGTGSLASGAAVASAALAIGYGKGRFLLAPRARANADRIRASASRAPLTSVYSAPAWLLVPLMIATGFGIRRTGIPVGALGGIYLTVGIGLLVGAVPAWSAWHEVVRGGK